MDFQRTVQLGDLIAHDPVSNTAGETKQVQFQNLRAPLLSRGTSFEYEPIVRVTYDYSTAAHKPITIVDRNELIRIQQQGQTLPSQQTATVQINALVIPAPALITQRKSVNAEQGGYIDHQ